jgi:hypothetical protein
LPGSATSSRAVAATVVAVNRVLLLLSAALLGCRAPAAPRVQPVVAAPSSAAPAAPVVAAPAASRPGTIAPICPEPVEHWPFAHELFPGCAPAPLRGPAFACAGDACPRPCRVDRAGDPDSDGATAYRYSGDGALHDAAAIAPIGERARPLGPPPPAVGRRYCTRSGGITRCQTDDRYGDEHTVAWATHGAEDRIVSVKIEDRLVLVDYTDGRVTAIRDRDDDDDHPRHEATTFTYDERGRLASGVGAGWGDQKTTYYRYYGDEAQPSVVVEDYDHGSGLARYTTKILRDGQGRPLQVTRLREDGTTRPRKSTETYSYDCPAPRPFAGALVAARAFRDLACACREPRCAVRAARDAERWRLGGFDLDTYEDPTDAERAVLDGVWRELDRCVWAASAMPESDS